MRAGALATGQEIEVAIAERLRKMSSQELAAFGIQAEMAFNRGAASAEQLALALDAQARTALRRLGVDADVALGGLSAKFTEAAGAVDIVAGQFDRLKAAGADAGAVLAQALDGALKAASSPAEIEALRLRIEQLGKDGKLAGEQVAAALDKIRQAADDITPGINSAAEALKQLGITSDADLKKTAERVHEAYSAVVELGGSVREQEAAFRKYAEAAIAANGGVADAALKAEAAMHGLAVEVDGTGRIFVRTFADQVAGAIDTATEAGGTLIDALGTLEQKAEKLADGVERIGSGFRNAAKQSTDAEGKVITAFGGYTGAYERAKSAGLDEATALALAAQYMKGINAPDALSRFSAAIDEAVLAAARAKAASEAATTTGRSVPKPTEVTRTEIHRVEIQLGNRTTAVNTSSAGDAGALVGLLRELEEFAMRA